MFWESNRDCHEFCKWWGRDESEVNTDDELIMQREPNGTFWAKEYTPEFFDSNVTGGTFRHDRTTTTIRTPTNMEPMRKYIKNDCIVEYQHEKWIVVSAQRKNIRNGMTEFAEEDDVPHYWYISLRR